MATRNGEPAALALERAKAIGVLKKAGWTAARINRAIGGARVESDRPQAKPIKDAQKKIAAIVRAFVDDLAARNWRVTVDDLVSDRRYRSISAPRMVAMWLVRDLLGGGVAFSVIGLFFGGRDHSTVMHAFQRGAYDQLQRDERLRLAADAVRRKFAGRRDS